MKGSVGKVLMFVENAYPDDTRVRNEATTLVGAGYSVTVVALRDGDHQKRLERVGAVQVYRMPRLELFNKVPKAGKRGFARLLSQLRSAVGYVVEYVYFSAACALMSLVVALREGFDVIHAHNPPDTLWAVALPWRLLGKRFVFDHHDLCPELYRSRYGESWLWTRALRWMEWCNLKLADVVIATNQSYKTIDSVRGDRRSEEIFVVRNGPNEGWMEMAAPSLRLRGLGKQILVYLGNLNPQDGVDYLLRALGHLVHDLGRSDFHCVIIGKGDSLVELQEMASRLQLCKFVEFTGWISDRTLKEIVAAADICVDPDPSSALNDVSTWIKVMEYMAYGKPIVAFDLKETRFSAQDAAMYVGCNDERAFAQAIATLMDDRERRLEMGRIGRARIHSDLKWSVVGNVLLDAYAYLCRNNVGGWERMSQTARERKPESVIRKRTLGV